MTEMPDNLRDLDRKLRSVRFGPRASFGPELLGRLRRGEQPSGSGRAGVTRHLATAAVAVLTAGGALALANLGSLTGTNAVTVDRCCYDLDGGGEPDDGVRVVAERDGRVFRLSIYEDRDRSGNHTTQDIIRLDRTGRPVLEEVTPAGLTTIRHCCQDLDGGGTPDDGVVVSGWPPDRVFTAAIYELR
jgi:hypothetical protein